MKLSKLFNNGILFGTLSATAMVPIVNATEYQHASDFIPSASSANCYQCELESVRLPNHSAVFVWQDETSIRFRLMASDEIDNPGAATSQAVSSISEVSSPRVIGDDNGEFSIFWLEDDEEIWSESFSAQGISLGDSQRVLDSSVQIEGFEVAKLSDGSRVLTYSADMGSDITDINTLRLHSDNTADGTATTIGQASSSGSKALSLLAMPNGEYWVGFETRSEAGFINPVFKRFSEESKLIDPVITVSESDTQDHKYANAAVMQDGSALFAWVAEGESTSAILSQRYDASGATKGENFALIVSTTSSLSNPKITPLRDASFLLSWEEDGQIMGQLFSYATEAQGELIALSQLPIAPAIAASSHRNIAIVAINPTRFVSIVREGDAHASHLVASIFDHNRESLAGHEDPVADAGPDILYHGRSTYYLNGANSKDHYGGTYISYNWNLVSKPEGSNANIHPSIVNPSFYPDKLGQYHFELTVTNLYNGQTQTDSVIFTSYNNRPVADAGDDKMATVVGRLIQLLGRESYDIDNDYKWYQWEVLQQPAESTATFDNPTSKTPRFAPDKRGTYRLQLVVSDAWSESEPDVMVINFDNAAPIAHVLYQNLALVGEQQVIDASNSYDSNGDPISFHWHVLSQPAGSTLDLSSLNQAQLNFAPTHAGRYALSLVVSDGDMSSEAFTFAVNVEQAEIEEPNEAPIAIAGNNIEISLLNFVVQLDGRQSFDPNGDEIMYNWSIVSAPDGSTSEFDSTSSHTPRLQIDALGQFVVQLVVSDGELTSAVDQIIIDVPNLAPIADAGLDHNVTPGQLVTLDGHNSRDPNAEAITYSWSFIRRPVHSNAALSDVSNAQPSFTADVPGTYALRLTVSDAAGLTSTDEVTIFASNQLPVANAGADITVTAIGEQVNLDGSASFDPEGLPLSYRWVMTAQPAGSQATLSHATIANPSFVADSHGSYRFSLMVSDGLTESVIDTINVTVMNQAPVANAGANQQGHLGQKINLDGSASYDADGQSISYQWLITSRPAESNAVLSSANSSTPHFVADVHGTYIVSLVVNDGIDNSASDRVEITIYNQVPTANAGVDQVIRGLNQTIHLDGRQSHDADGQALSFYWEMTSKPVDSEATLLNSESATPYFVADVQGAYQFALMVSDSIGMSVADIVDMTVLNHVPVAHAGADQTINGVLQQINLDAHASYDADDHALTYQWMMTSKPTASEASLNNTSSMTPNFVADMHGTYVISLMVNDGIDNSEIDSVEITVRNQRPIANAGADMDVEGVNSEIQLDASLSYDPEGQAISYRWSLVSAPTGSQTILDSNNTVSPLFAADLAGVYVFELIVSDGDMESVADNVTVNVNDIPETEAPSELSARDHIANALTFIQGLEPEAFKKKVKRAKHEKRVNSMERLERRQYKMERRLNRMLFILDKKKKQNLERRRERVATRLERRVVIRSNGCQSEEGVADRDDWFISCELQTQFMSHIQSAISLLRN